MRSSLTDRFYYRVLLATIRDLGNYPCPRCLVFIKKIPALGTVLDMRARLRQARHDDVHYRSKITQARGLIYKQNYTVNSEYVEDVLKDQSLVPTRVSLPSHLRPLVDLHRLERIFDLPV